MNDFDFLHMDIEQNVVECNIFPPSLVKNVKSCFKQQQQLLTTTLTSKHCIMAVAGSAKQLKTLPTPSGWPIIGTLGHLIAAGGAAKLHEYVDKRHKELGPIYKETIGPVTGVFVCDSQLMRRVFALEGKCPRHIIPETWALYNETYGQQRGLLFMDGEEWYSYRKLLNNIILKPDPHETVEALEIAADNLITKWDNIETIDDLESDLYMWSLQSIIAILLGSKTYKESQTLLQPLSKELSTHIQHIFTESANLSLIPAKLAMKLGLPPWKRFVHVVQTSIEKAKDLVRDLKQLSCNGILKQLETCIDNEEDLQRIVIDLILAAGDTTAYTFQWIMYLIGTTPAVQDELKNSVLKSNMINNSLIKNTVKETLRLYPVAPFITRYLPEDSDLGGYFVAKGELVIMSLYSSGRNENYFTNAKAFNPKRWERDGTTKGVPSPYASVPFAMGPRSCIGRRIAELQIGVTLSKILQRFTVEVLNSNNVDIQLRLITVPATPIRLKLTRDMTL